MPPDDITPAAGRASRAIEKRIPPPATRGGKTYQMDIADIRWGRSQEQRMICGYMPLIQNDLQIGLKGLDAGGDILIESEPAGFASILVAKEAPMSTQERLQVLRETKPNTWIAFSQDESRVVASAPSYAEVVEMAERSGELDPVLVKTPEEWVPLVF